MIHGTRYYGTLRLARTDVHTVAHQLPCAIDTHAMQEAGTIHSPYEQQGSSSPCQHASPLLPLQDRLLAALALAAASRRYGELGRVLLTEVRHTGRFVGLTEEGWVRSAAAPRDTE